MYYGVRTLNSTLNEDKTLRMSTFVVTTSNVANYGITFTYDASVTGPKLTDSKVEMIINRYGSWNSVNKISLYGTHLSVPYSDGKKTIVASYNLKT